MAAVIGKRMEQAPTQVGNGSIPHTVKARPPFFFMVASRGWEFVESEGCWLPVLKRHYIDPGVNGITASRNPSQAYSEREQRGFAVIRPEDARLGEFRHYVQTLPYQGGGSYCLSVFEAAEVMPGGRVFIQRDEAEYNRFRRHLVASGMVPPLDPRWKRELLGEMRQTLNRKAARAAAAMPGSPAHAKFATYEAWFKAAEAADGPTDEAKPKRSRARAEA
jgi:hypothetical protein